MKKRNTLSVKAILMMIGIIFFIMGVIFVIIGGVILKSSINFKNDAEKTTAVVTDIDSYTYRSGGERRTSYHVYVEYTVDGVVYENMLNGYNSSMMRKGKEIDIYYNPDDPYEIEVGSYTFPAVFMGVGGLFAVLGAIFICINVVSGTHRKKLIRNGDVLTGTITDVKMNMSVTINGRHPFKAECEVTGTDGGRYLYSSENINEDISNLIGSDVTVYVDKDDRSKYYVDIRELLNRYLRENNIHDYR